MIPQLADTLGIIVCGFLLPLIHQLEPSAIVVPTIRLWYGAGVGALAVVATCVYPPISRRIILSLRY